MTEHLTLDHPNYHPLNTYVVEPVDVQFVEPGNILCSSDGIVDWVVLSTTNLGFSLGARLDCRDLDTGVEVAFQAPLDTAFKVATTRVLTSWN